VKEQDFGFDFFFKFEKTFSSPTLLFCDMDVFPPEIGQNQQSQFKTRVKSTNGQSAD
jgi:hypothetical protein